MVEWFGRARKRFSLGFNYVGWSVCLFVVDCIFMRFHVAVVHFHDND